VPQPTSTRPSGISTAEGYSLAAQGVTPAIRGQIINSQVIDNNTGSFRDRLNTNVVNRPAPTPGMSRAAVEAMWGPSMTSQLRPGSPVSLYVNNQELIDGHVINRTISNRNLKVYEVTYTDSTEANPSAEACVVSVRPIFTPAIGDHENMYSLLLNSQDNLPLYGFTNHDPNKGYYVIPEPRFRYYRDLADNPFELIRVSTDAQGIVIAQEFVEGRLPLGTYGFSSAQRYTGI
jgi:hypothetical protein